MFERATLVVLLGVIHLPAVAGAEPPAGSVLVAGSHSAEVAGAALRELGRRGARAVAVAPVSAPEASAERVQAAALSGQVEASLRRVEELFYSVKLQAAASLVAEELGRSALALAFAGRFDLLRGLHLWQGICGTKLGQREAAREAFHAAAALDDRALDPTRFPPAVSTAYAAAARELAARARGKLVLAVAPADAELRVDGKPVQGTTLSLVQGVHWLEARAIGHAPTVRRVMVSEREQRLEVRLAAASQAQLQEELYRRQQKGGLELHRPAVVAALGRLQGVAEALGIQERSVGGQTELSFQRIRCSDAQLLERVVERVPAAERALAVQRALLRLWPVEAVAVHSGAPVRTPVYRRWWFWALIGGGVAVAGGATAAGIVLARKGRDLVYVAKVPAP